jgi:hypothetical protein
MRRFWQNVTVLRFWHTEQDLHWDLGKSIYTPPPFILSTWYYDNKHYTSLGVASIAKARAAFLVMRRAVISLLTGTIPLQTTPLQTTPPQKQYAYFN